MKFLLVTILFTLSSISFANEYLLKDFVVQNLAAIEQDSKGVSLDEVKECKYTGRGWNQKPLGFCSVSGSLDCANCSTEFGIVVYEKLNDSSAYFMLVPMTGEDYQ